MPDPDGFTLTAKDREIFLDQQKRLESMPHSRSPWPPAKSHGARLEAHQAATTAKLRADLSQAHVLAAAASRRQRERQIIACAIALMIGVVLGIAVADGADHWIAVHGVRPLLHDAYTWLQQFQAAWHSTMSNG